MRIINPAQSSPYSKFIQDKNGLATSTFLLHAKNNGTNNVGDLIKLKKMRDQKAKQP